MDATSFDRSSRAADLEAFDRLIKPLEQVARRNLRGEGRKACLRAFCTHPDAFARLCNEALERGRNPLALLSQMVFDGDHELELIDKTLIPDTPTIEATRTVSAAAAISTTSGLAQWLQNTGAEYAESPTDFRAELAEAFKITDAELVQALRQIALGNDDEAKL